MTYSEIAFIAATIPMIFLVWGVVGFIFYAIYLAIVED